MTKGKESVKLEVDGISLITTYVYYILGLSSNLEYWAAARKGADCGV